ncbi:hemin uptake protein HemP [Pseudolysobacter antarcticus]|uniref:Hemin uptake protein HemP n=1 Tax=Pseudolysobacter antarcticus TaxID=2511995 RepID=A0A411HIC6_9GAMM|nr:hemin uptake protein HemP [Pseudolysobacter antarcticus]QBB70279.1 hemin uptake protein HemP [Pseudolysobacter antarcticus]
MLETVDTTAQTAPSHDASVATTIRQPAAYHARSNTPVTRIDSRELLQGHRELVIEHVGLEYRLQVTRNGKLILTK